MRTSLLSVLLLTFMMVSVSKQGWLRSAGRSMRRAAKYVDRHSNEINAALTLARAVGKREAGRPPCPPWRDGNGMDRKAAMQLLEKFHLECPKFAVTSQAGLSKKAVIAAFNASNENGDQNLDKDELVIFETVLDAFEQCLEEKPTPKVQ